MNFGKIKVMKCKNGVGQVLILGSSGIKIEIKLLVQIGLLCDRLV